MNSNYEVVDDKIDTWKHTLLKHLVLITNTADNVLVVFLFIVFVVVFFSQRK